MAGSRQYPGECADHALQNAHGDRWTSAQHNFHTYMSDRDREGETEWETVKLS